MVSAYLFGVSGKINAFTVAFQIPNLVRALVADAALSGAFVPVFSELLVKGERARAWRVASTIFWLVLLGLGGLTAVFMLAAPLLLRPFGDPGGDIDLAVGLSRVLFPIVVLLGLSGIVVAILNSYEQFAVPALTPVLWNVAIIVGLALGVPAAHGEDAELYVYAGSVLVATLLQFLMPLPWLRGLDGRLRPVLDWRDPAVKRFFVLMLPVTLTLGLINVNAVIGTLFASRLIDPELAPAAIDKAFRLYMLPQGMFAVAVTTVLFPALSRLAARDDRPGFGRTLDAGLRQIAFLLVPAGARLRRARGADRAARLSARRVRPGSRRRSSRARSPRSASGSCSTAGCCCSIGPSTASRTAGSRRRSPASTSPSTSSLYIVLYRVGVWGIPLAVSIANLVAAPRCCSSSCAAASRPRREAAGLVAGPHRRRLRRPRRRGVRDVVAARLGARRRRSVGQIVAVGGALAVGAGAM